MADDELQAWAIRYQMPIVDLKNLELKHETLAHISASMARHYQLVPVDFDEGTLTVAMPAPPELQALDDLRFILDIRVQGALARRAEVEAALVRWYP
ncbi:MAG: hypothetical protein M5U26_06900 [Planctomycetota bacterium]|nr:hypothetical protein [Planctomycetota bacterium]